MRRVRFQLGVEGGSRVGSQGPFEACTDNPQTHSYYFATGTMGGCATLYLYERSGDDFGATEWSKATCPQQNPTPGPGPGPIDSTPPKTTATAPAANGSGWSSNDGTIQFSAVDTGTDASGVRAVHVALSGADTGSLVLPASGAVTVKNEGTTRVAFFAIDNAGNTESQSTLTVRLDRTAPTVAIDQ